MILAEVIIYTKLVCPYCINAKELFDSKNVTYKEIRVDQNPDYLKEMLSKSNGRRTVPQIFIGETHVGGFDDLAALSSSELETLLNA